MNPPFEWEIELARKLSDILARVLAGAFLTEGEAIAAIVGDSQETDVAALAVAMLALKRSVPHGRGEALVEAANAIATGKSGVREELAIVGREFQWANQFLKPIQIDGSLDDLIAVVEVANSVPSTIDGEPI